MNPVIYFPFLRAGDVTYTAYARRIEALDSAVHLCITTRCDSARDPHGEREVLSLTLGRDELLHLSDVVLGGMQLLDGNNGETPDWMRPESHPGLHCKEGDVVIVVQVEPGHEANYLPPLAASETEVARITLESTTADVKAVYAQPTDDGWIRYKVVDEYGDEESLASSTALRPEPMSLGEFADFFLNACGLVATLEDNFGDDPKQALAFFAAESDFYPGLDRVCRVKIRDASRL